MKLNASCKVPKNESTSKIGYYIIAQEIGKVLKFSFNHPKGIVFIFYCYFAPILTSLCVRAKPLGT
jgi:hypothetical protein